MRRLLITSGTAMMNFNPGEDGFSLSEGTKEETEPRGNVVILHQVGDRRG